MATSGFGTSSRSPTRFDKTAVTPLSAGWTGGAFTGNTLTVRSQTYHAGWLWKMAAAPPLIKWKKYWVSRVPRVIVFTGAVTFSVRCRCPLSQCAFSRRFAREAGGLMQAFFTRALFRL